jgi:hypothetical protein
VSRFLLPCSTIRPRHAPALCCLHTPGCAAAPLRLPPTPGLRAQSWMSHPSSWTRAPHEAAALALPHRCVHMAGLEYAVLERLTLWWAARRRSTQQQRESLVMPALGSAAWRPSAWQGSCPLPTAVLAASCSKVGRCSTPGHAPVARALRGGWGADTNRAHVAHRIQAQDPGQRAHWAQALPCRWPCAQAVVMSAPWPPACVGTSSRCACGYASEDPLNVERGAERAPASLYVPSSCCLCQLAHTRATLSVLKQGGAMRCGGVPHSGVAGPALRCPCAGSRRPVLAQRGSDCRVCLLLFCLFGG